MGAEVKTSRPCRICNVPCTSSSVVGAAAAIPQGQHFLRSVRRGASRPEGEQGTMSWSRTLPQSYQPAQPTEDSLGRPSSVLILHPLSPARSPLPSRRPSAAASSPPLPSQNHLRSPICPIPRAPPPPFPELRAQPSAVRSQHCQRQRDPRAAEDDDDDAAERFGVEGSVWFRGRRGCDVWYRDWRRSMQRWGKSPIERRHRSAGVGGQRVPLPEGAVVSCRSYTWLLLDFEVSVTLDAGSGGLLLGRKVTRPGGVEGRAVGQTCARGL